MLNPYAPDPFSLQSWTTNLMPVDDADARAWWFASLIAVIARRPMLDDLAMRLAEVAPRASA